MSCVTNIKIVDSTYLKGLPSRVLPEIFRSKASIRAQWFYGINADVDFESAMGVKLLYSSKAGTIEATSLTIFQLPACLYQLEDSHLGSAALRELLYQAMNGNKAEENRFNTKLSAEVNSVCGSIKFLYIR